MGIELTKVTFPDTNYIDLDSRVDKTGDTMTGALTLYKEGTTENNYSTQLIFKNKDTTTGKTSTGYFMAYEGGQNGINFVIRPGGNMFIGSGESANAHYNLYEHSTTEHFYATSDSNMFLQANGGTIANRKGILINTSHEILPCAADVATNNIGSIGNSTYKWGSIYATSLHGSLIGDISGGTGLTSSQVTTALGFTPYDSTNPSGYTSNTGTITSVKTTAGAHTTINVSNGEVSFKVPTKTSHLTNDSGFLTSYTETDPTVPSWAKASSKPTYSWSEITSKPLVSETQSSLESVAITETTNRQYAVNYDSNGKLSVNVPWSNTNTAIRIYRQTTGYSKDYPIVVSRTQASGIGTAGTNGSYTAVYGVMGDDTTKIPTINPLTGEIKAVKFTGDISSGTGLTSTQITTALGFTPGTSNLTLGTSSTTALKGDTKYAGSSSAGGAATSAAKLTNTSKIGDTNKPVYFTASGVPSAISYTINKSVPADAVFTDNNTTYTISTGTNVGQIKVTPSSGNAYDVDIKGFGTNQKLEALYTSGSSAALPGSTFFGNGKRGYLFIVFNSKTPSSSNRAVACIPMVINTVYYVPFVVGTSFKSARFELQAPTSGEDGIVINFLSISDSNFGVEAIWG